MRCYPSVSIVIPAYNAQDTITRCLRSISSLDYPQDKLEIIIVDNASTDDTAKIVKDLGFGVVSFSDGNVGAVRNCGSNLAVGDVIAHTDSDCVLPAQWLVNAMRVMQSDKTIGAVGGGCLVPNDATLLEKAWVTVQKENLKEVKYLPACNLILKKALFDTLGGFNEGITAGEDDDLSLSISKAGLNLISVKECYVYHLGYPKTFWEILKRQMWHGRSALDLAAKTSSMLWATLIFCFFAFALFLLFIVRSSSVTMWLLCLSGLGVMPLALMMKKMVSGDGVIMGWQRFFFLFLTFFFFFVGRSIGLLHAISLRFFSHHPKIYNK